MRRFPALKFSPKNYKKTPSTFALYAGIAVLVLSPFIYLSLTSSKKTEAAPWAETAGTFLKRKQITLVNNSGQTFESGTTYSIAVDTKTIYTAGDLQADCDDIRIFYQPNSSTSTKINYYVDVAEGATNCSDSTATKIYFPLQANISNSAEDTSYYFYYKNQTASSEATVDAFDIAAAAALMACPFEGDSTCINGDGSEAATTATGAIRYAGGESALSFDGVNDRVSISHSSQMNISDKITISLWTKRNTTQNTNYTYLVDRNHSGSYSINYNNSDGLYRLYANLSTGGWQTVTDSNSSGNTPANTWVHLAATYDSSTGAAKFYVNGSQVDSQTKAGTIGTGTASASIGGTTSSDQFYSGLIDEVAIWNRPLALSEISSIYNGGVGRPIIREESVVGLWHMDENGDDPRNTGKVIDDSGYANHGTITGAKYVAGLVGIDGTADNGKPSSQSYASHKGVFIEEGTTNKITNPSFEHGTFDTNWTAQQSGDGIGDVVIATTRGAITSGATGTQDFTTTDLGGKTPKAALFILTYGTSDETAADHAVLSFGAATGASNEWVATITDEHNQTTSDSSESMNLSNSIRTLTPGTGTAEGAAEFSSWLTNGVRINITNDFPAAYLLTVVLFAGDDLQAHANFFSSSGSIDGAIDVTDPGFTPDVVLTASGNSMVSYGMAYYNGSTVTQRAMGVRWKDTQGAANNFIQTRDDSAAIRLSDAGFDYRLEFSDFDANGFTSTNRVGAGINVHGYLALNLDATTSAWIGTHTTPTSTGANTETGPGFPSQLLFMLPNFAEAYSTHYSDANAGTFGLSVATASTQYSNTLQSEDAADPTNTQSISDNQLINLPSHSGGTGIASTLSSITGTGWNTNYTAVTGTSKLWPALAIEGEPVGGSITDTEETAAPFYKFGS